MTNFHEVVSRYQIADYTMRLMHFRHHYVYWLTHDIPLTLVPKE